MTLERDRDETGHGAGDVDHQGAPPQRRGRGHETQHQPGDDLPPARLRPAQVLADYEVQPEPAQDDHERSGDDGPDDRPGLPDERMQIGEFRWSAGEDVAHTAQASSQSPASCAAGPLDDAAQGPVDSLDDPAGERPGPAAGIERSEHPLPQAARLVHGDHGVETHPGSSGKLRDEQGDQVGAVGIELGLPVDDGVLERVLPALPEPLLSPVQLVDGADPLPGVGVSDPVVEVCYLAVEDGPCDEAPVVLSLYEFLAGVDEHRLVRRALRQGRVSRAVMASNAATSSAAASGTSRLTLRGLSGG